MADTASSDTAPQLVCLLSDGLDDAERGELISALQSAVAKLDLPEPTPAQLATRQRNHDRLIRLGLEET